MKTPAWTPFRRIAESSRARIVSFFFFTVLIGGFTFLAFHARANLAPSREFQVSLAQQTKEIRTANSMNDFYDHSWLANDRNFVELAGWVEKVVHFSASPSLDPKFKQELNDYAEKNRARLPEESSQIEKLSFTDGILQLHQSRLLDMYDQLDLIFQTLQDIVKYWDLDGPMERAAKMTTIQDAFSIASIEFQATTSSHKKILNYARLLDEQSKQASQAELDRIQTNRTLFNISIAGGIVSVLALGGWVVWVKRVERRE